MKRPKFPKERSVVYISDYPIKAEIEQELPYSAASNLTLMGDLFKVGIKQDDCFYTYLSYTRPEEDNKDFKNSFKKWKELEVFEDGYGFGGELYHHIPFSKDDYISDSLLAELNALVESIRKVKPKLIIIGGKWGLYLLTGIGTWKQTVKNLLGNLGKYRASILSFEKHLGLDLDCIVIPVYPATLRYKMPDKLPIIHWDYGKLGTIYTDIKDNSANVVKYIRPDNFFYYGQDFYYIIGFLSSLLDRCNKEETYISVDIETRQATIDCIGLTSSTNSGICIAFSTLENPHLFTETEEFTIINILKELLTHKNCKIIGQNFSYDAQYIWKFWLFKVEAYIDTMITHHVLYNYMPKSLDFLASIYCDSYSYWKDMQKHTFEGK